MAVLQPLNDAVLKLSGVDSNLLMAEGVMIYVIDAPQNNCKSKCQMYIAISKLLERTSNCFKQRRVWKVRQRFQIA